MTRRRTTQAHPEAPWIREVLERYERRLTLYATRLLGDVERARDAVQDTFLRLCNQEREEIEARVAVWLFTVCRNRCHDVTRKESRMNHLEDEGVVETPGIAVAPAEAAEARDEVSRVLQTMTTLPEKQQEVLRLKFQHGLSYKEISRVTQDNIGTVGWLLHEGLKSLRGKLAASEIQGAEA